MKTYLLILVAALASASQAHAGSCTNEQEKRGCHTESYECNRPTHYTCNRCACRIADLISQGLSEENYVTADDSQTLNDILNGPGFKKVRIELPGQGLTVEASCCDKGCCGTCCNR